MTEPTAILLRPKFVALDTSHLGRLIDDASSNNPTRQSRAQALFTAFEHQGGVLLLSWHHLQELLTHEGADVIARRTEYIQSYRMVATPRSIAGDGLPGSILDLQSLEVRAAFENPGAGLAAVRDAAAQGFHRVVSGEEIIRQFVEAWPLLKEVFPKRSARTREIVAISRSDFAKNGKMKLADFLGRGLRSPADRAQMLATMHARLSADIRERGDERIPDGAATSAAFFRSIEATGEALPPDADPALGILEVLGIDAADVSPDMTLDEIGELSNFHRKLATVNERLGLPWHDLKARVTAERLPSMIIQRAVARFRPDTRRWSGGDLPDTYLACLSPYTDIVYVDKRTHEALRVARPKVPSLKSILRRIEKAKSYTDIAVQLS